MQWKFAHRDAERDVLNAAGADAGDFRMALMGAAGAGKTYLARSCAQRFSATHPGVTVHWVSATASTSDIPFGAVSHLYRVSGRTDPAAALNAALAAICPPDSDVLVVVDDAHLLDSHSAALVHQLVAVASAQIVVTCRSGEPSPNAITALWKDGFVERVDLAPLTRGETQHLVEQVLGGALRAGSGERIYALSQGNPLYLRHLVEGAEQQGGLRLVDDLWELQGSTPLSQALADLIDLRLAALPPSVLQVLQFLAVEEPLAVSLLSSLTATAAVEAAEDAGAARVVLRGEELVAYSGHPLYVERLRQTSGRLATRRLRTDIVRMLAAERPTSVSDRLRVVALALDSDLPPRPRDVVVAAFEALYLNDLPLTERLARAAVRRADSVMARTALAHSLCWQGRGAEAEATLAALDPAAMTELELLTWVLARASNQFWVLGQAQEAATWLNEMRPQLPGKSAQVVINGLAAQFAMNLAELRQCLDLTTHVLAADDASDEAVAWAASSAALACARTGAFGEVDGHASRCLETRSPDGVRYTAGLARAQTAILHCRTEAAFAIAAEYLTSAGFRPGRAQAQVVLGQAMIARGDVAAAIATLEEADAHYSDTGDAWQSLNLSLLSTALGQRGDNAAASATLRRAKDTHDMRTALHRPELYQARAWTHAAARNIPGAQAAARDGINEAMQTGQFAQALLAHHDAIRLGDSSRVRDLARLTERLACPLGSIILTQARGLADNDGASLMSAASQLETAGMLSAAADAAAQSASAHAVAGDRPGELNARNYAAELSRRCSGLSTPALDTVLRPLPLTAREREIAVMVAERKSNKAIADHLGISVRTVETHIYRACEKLDITSRAQLGDAVKAAEP